jgi:hypothetical protein
LYSALLRDLPDIEYRQWTPALKNAGVAHKDAPLTTRRPTEDDVEAFHFTQTWGSTALGFGGIGGSSMTSAYTTVVLMDGAAAVYFSGRHAYSINEVSREFMMDLSNCNMNARNKAGEYCA